MNDVTPLQEQAKPAERANAPVTCKRGHLNDPYPENGQCAVCSCFLPGNPYKLDSEKGKDARARGHGGKKAIEASAQRILEDEGIPWDEATEGMRLLAIQFAKNGNNKTLELILQQIGVLKAKPKSAEGDTVVEYQVSLTAATVEGLKRSLADLESLL